MTAFFICFYSLFCSPAANPASSAPPPPDTDYARIVIYTWGLTATPVLQDDCALELQTQYGFTYQSRGGCMTDDLQKLSLLNAHNRRAYYELEMRHGADWRARYKEELAVCRSEAEND